MNTELEEAKRRYEEAKQSFCETVEKANPVTVECITCKTVVTTTEQDVHENWLAGNCQDCIKRKQMFCSYDICKELAPKPASLVAIKGSSSLRRMEVLGQDGLSGYVRRNGKTIPVRRRGVNDEWYQLGMGCEVETIFQKGKVL